MIQIEIRNNICCATSDDPRSPEFRSFLRCYLTKEENVKRIYYRGKRRKVSFDTVHHKLYSTDDRNRYYFPRGLLTFIAPDSPEIRIVDNSTYKYKFSMDQLTGLESILRPGASFDLRGDQVMAVRKALFLKRGIIQLPTGSGKSEVMSAVIKKLEECNPNIKVIVIEPTDVLVTKTSERFNRYSLNSRTYKEVRGSDFSDLNVLVAHTQSLLNDCGENPHLLDDFDAVFWDECQHCKCDTWKLLNSYLSEVEYSIGLSALAVNETRISSTDLQSFTIDEVMVIGSTGRVILYIPAGYYIDRDILATPVIFQLSCELSSILRDAKKALKKTDEESFSDWHFLREYGVESPYRSLLAAKTSGIFLLNGRRVLVLVGTKAQAEVISKNIFDLIEIPVAISYGGGKAFTYTENGLTAYRHDIVKDFDEGYFNVLVSTNHLDEGVDLSNLDVCILASGGKKDRRIIQRIGRALRVNKTGKYAYIIDFYDRGSGVLEKHSNARMKLFRETVMVPSELIFNRTSLVDLKSNFYRLEGIGNGRPN